MCSKCECCEPISPRAGICEGGDFWQGIVWIASCCNFYCNDQWFYYDSEDADQMCKDFACCGHEGELSGPVCLLCCPCILCIKYYARIVRLILCRPDEEYTRWCAWIRCCEP